MPLRKKEIIDETLKNDENETINRAEVVWGYDGSEIPAHDWPSHFPCGCGPNQSPININLRNVKYSEDLAPLKINYSITPHYLINDGHAIRVHYQPGSTIEGKQVITLEQLKIEISEQFLKFCDPIKGAGLENPYELVQIHFHWGSGKGFGSEHTINGKAGEAEVHFVHWNSVKYETVAEAMENPDGLAVLGNFRGFAINS